MSSPNKPPAGRNTSRISKISRLKQKDDDPSVDAGGTVPGPDERLDRDLRLPAIPNHTVITPPDRVPLLPSGQFQVPPPPVIKPKQFFEVIRSADLVSLTVTWSGLDLVDGALSARADGPGGLLIFTFPFQHLGEQATYEVDQGEDPPLIPKEVTPDGEPVPDESEPDEEPPTIPVEGFPARSSRVVVQVPAGTQVEVSTAAFLAALAQYPMVVHPLATPGQSRQIRPPGSILFDVFFPRLSETTAAQTQALAAFQPGEAVAQRAKALAQLRRDLGAPDLSITIEELIDRTRIPIEPLQPNPKQLSRPPGTGETAIEAPFRLIISPSSRSGWSHAPEPVKDASETAVELWHTRLGERRGNVLAEVPQSIRAVWARDRERFHEWATDEIERDDKPDPFRMSLDSKDRHMLVRQSSETWVHNGSKIADPTPVEARRLYLSSLGSWLDLHGSWNTKPWSEAGLAAILTWDHEAPMGRDQYVRVTYPGYLFPFGHLATLVKVTERKIKEKANPKAALYQRMFLVIGEPVKTYASHKNPFTSVEITPTITPPLDPECVKPDTFFVPRVGGADFAFVLHCVDADGHEVKLTHPLVWVAIQYELPEEQEDSVSTAFEELGEIGGFGQSIAFAPSVPGGVDNSLPTVGLTFTGKRRTGTSVPALEAARGAIPAVEHMNPTGAVEFRYADAWLNHAFDSKKNPGEVWAALLNSTELTFGEGGTSSAGAGGFIAPSLSIAGLSRKQGPVGDVAGVTAGKFDPAAYFGNALPKLFGSVSLLDIIEGGGLEDAPALITKSLAKVEALMGDIAALGAAVADAAAQAQASFARAQQTAKDLVEQGRDALAHEIETKAKTAETAVTSLLGSDAVDGARKAIDLAGAPVGSTDPLKAALTKLGSFLDEVEDVATHLTPLARNQLLGLVARLRPAVSDADDTVALVVDFVKGIDTTLTESRFSLTWQPRLKSFPSGGTHLLELPERGLTVAVEGQAGKTPKVDILAELRGFALILPPGKPLIKLPFDHLTFRAGSSGKTEVDASVGNIEFLGMLGFVERIKHLIPPDGFSDPPYVDVSPAGAVAGYSLALPSLAIGVFNLSNVSLAADIQVPFLGDVVSVGFAFCTRERPFTLAVLCLGGGGWFVVRTSPRGLEVLEVGLEAGAYLAINLGVASGSVSVALGIYMRIEADEGSLTAYFRVRGAVSVLGLITAAIELYLALSYHFPSGKMRGIATITVKVKVLCFSKSVAISCEREFAGSNGDPTFREVMGVQADFTSPLWNDYCLAFAEESSHA